MKDGFYALSPILFPIDLPAVDDSLSPSPPASPLLSSAQPLIEHNVLLLSAPNPAIPASSTTADVLELSPLPAFQMSSPPSSSPPQIFSSSPLPSSQSSLYNPSSDGLEKVHVILVRIATMLIHADISIRMIPLSINVCRTSKIQFPRIHFDPRHSIRPLHLPFSQARAQKECLLFLLYISFPLHKSVRHNWNPWVTGASWSWSILKNQRVKNSRDHCFSNHAPSETLFVFIMEIHCCIFSVTLLLQEVDAPNGMTMDIDGEVETRRLTPAGSNVRRLDTSVCNIEYPSI